MFNRTLMSLFSWISSLTFVSASAYTFATSSYDVRDFSPVFILLTVGWMTTLAMGCGFGSQAVINAYKGVRDF